MDTDEGLVGDRECLQDIGLLGWVRYACQGLIGDSLGIGYASDLWVHQVHSA